MSKRKQPIEATVVQFFQEAPPDAAESMLRIVQDIVKRREAEGGVRKNPFREQPEKEKRKRKPKAAKCERCNDTGVIETGNNDLPCSCPAGDTATFNTAEAGHVSGLYVKRHLLNDSPEPLQASKPGLALLPTVKEDELSGFQRSSAAEQGD